MDTCSDGILWPRRQYKDMQKAFRKPPNAFILFSNTYRHVIRGTNPEELSNKHVSKILGVMWKELPAEKKNKFINQAEKLSVEHKNRQLRGSVIHKKSYEKKQAIQESSGDIDNTVRRPPNAYILFSNTYRHIIRSKNPRELTNREVSKMLGTMWKGLDAEEKYAFINKANILAKEHKEQHPGYVYSPQEARKRKAMRSRGRKKYEYRASIDQSSTLYGLESDSINACDIEDMEEPLILPEVVMGGDSGEEDSEIPVSPTRSDKNIGEGPDLQVDIACENMKQENDESTKEDENNEDDPVLEVDIIYKNMKQEDDESIRKGGWSSSSGKIESRKATEPDLFTPDLEASMSTKNEMSESFLRNSTQSSPRSIVLSSHVHFSLVDGYYKCLSCNKRCDSADALKAHSAEHVVPGVLYCNMCLENTNDMDFDSSQGVSQTKGRSIECGMCEQLFSSTKQLNLHVCPEDKLYKCDICNLSFLSKRSWRKHCDEHSRQRKSPKLYECDVCNAPFSNWTRFKNHFNAHSREDTSDDDD